MAVVGFLQPWTCSLVPMSLDLSVSNYNNLQQDKKTIHFQALFISCLFQFLFNFIIYWSKSRFTKRNREAKQSSTSLRIINYNTRLKRIRIVKTYWCECNKREYNRVYSKAALVSCSVSWIKFVGSLLFSYIFRFYFWLLNLKRLGGNHSALPMKVN